MRVLHILVPVWVLICVAANANGLTLPDCVNKERLETEIHLFINDDVLSEYSRDFVQSKINTWVAYSNLVLSNSCIPISRKVTHIEYVPSIDNTWFQDVDIAEKFLKLSLDREISEVDSQGVPVFKGIVFANWRDSFDSDWCGYASGSSFFFTIALNCSDDVMEHEIGHLSGASHDIKTLMSYNPNFDVETYLISSYPKKEMYSFATVCSGRGTIMSYEKDVIPAYSNPTILFNDQPCGDEDSANNAKVLRDFAQKYARNR